MHTQPEIAITRVERFLREVLGPRVHRDRIELSVAAWTEPGEPVAPEVALSANFEPFDVGSPWGRPWGTTWMHLTGSIPVSWPEDGHFEAIIDLGFDADRPGFQAEGTVYDDGGRVVKGVAPRNRHVPVTGAPGEQTSFYVEASANPEIMADGHFVPTPLGDPGTAGLEPLYRLAAADLVLFDRAVWELVQDFTALVGLVDAVDPEDVTSTAAAGRAVLADVMALPAHASAHTLHAVGHAHIDSAWLWPLRETPRKIARTFSNVVSLMDENDDFVFTASAAQHYAWVEEHHPELFERIRSLVDKGRFVTTGGMWVESDTNMPGGEAMVRQFVVGKRWFREKLGQEPQVVWLPDSFGYSAALPQIMALSGNRWFLTQKLSWNETNRMPHHTFSWEGIDGTQIFTHFPPVDTYNSDLSAAELARAQRQYSEKGRANRSMVPFGWGDGGGGPTREMVAAAARAADLEGSPRVVMSTPEEFFERAEAEYPDPPVWSGELYLERHRGTYTSQARTKRGNRRSEHLLREAEMWAAMAAVRTGEAYPYDTFARLWQTALLNQFHDILPGSSIAWVHREAERTYERVAAELEAVIQRSLAALAGTGDRQLAVNAGPLPNSGVGAMRVAAVPEPPTGARVVRDKDGVVLENTLVRARFDNRGLLVSLLDLVADRQVVPPDAPGNLFQLFRDTPREWDAWDIDATYENVGSDLTGEAVITIVVDRPDAAGVRFDRSVGASTISQTVSLSAGSPALDLAIDIDWHERQKLLKLAFPLDLHADRAASEIQFGHIHRPTHANTSWDAARFETCAHRWVHVGEPGYGVSVANDSTYGHDISRRSEDHGTVTTVRLSLLRAPVFPDPDADQGRHTLRVALRPGSSIADAVSEGYRLNLPLRRITGHREVTPLV